jgi:hypothetical protein
MEQPIDPPDLGHRRHHLLAGALQMLIGQGDLGSYLLGGPSFASGGGPRRRRRRLCHATSLSDQHHPRKILPNR